MKPPLLAVSLWLLCFAGCSSDTERLPDLPRADRSLGNISKFISAVATSENVSVYEGLPHQNWERDAYTAELRRGDLIWLEGYPFYRNSLALTDDEKQTLTAIAVNKESHVPHVLPKFCGEFHPDYAIVWTAKGKTSGSLICFGCEEWKNFTPQGRLHEDLAPSAYRQLQTLLSKHVVQRPRTTVAEPPSGQSAVRKAVRP
jgi:hypothetical protein